MEEVVLKIIKMEIISKIPIILIILLTQVSSKPPSLPLQLLLLQRVLQKFK